MSGLFGDAPALEPAEAPGLFGDAAPAKAAPYRVLARKYRPTRFEDLIGQDVMVRTLRNAFALNRIAHAFMLTGVRGVGKTTTARIIARALNCVGPDGTGGPTATPCGVCPNCTAILADRHPDVIEMDAATRNKVDDAREIIEAVRYKPLQARTKVFILDEVHMLTTQAFNALLKTLEEPPPHIAFIFATTEIRKVPITVLSRCQRFDLRRISAAELAGLFTRVAAAEQVSVSAPAMELIARAADGSARDGLSLLDQAIARMEGAEVSQAEVADMLGLADRQLVFELMEAVAAGDVQAALAITDRAHAFGADLGTVLGDLLELVHMLARLRSVPELRAGPALPEAERTRGAALADQLPIPVLSRTWQMLLKGVAEVDAAPDRRAAAEMVLIRLCHVMDMPPPGELVRRLTPAARPADAPPPGPPAAAPSPGLSGGAPPPGPSGGVPLPGPSGGPAGGSMRAVSGGAAVAAAVQPDAPPPPRLAGFRDVVALCSGRDPTLHSHLRHSVHLVRFAPGVVELRPEPASPRDLAARLGALLQAETGRRWTVALSTAQGEPTLGEQEQAADAARRHAAADHPLVRAILEAFPGAKLGAVRDAAADPYGLPAVAAPAAAASGEPDMPDFAPPDAEPADTLEYDP